LSSPRGCRSFAAARQRGLDPPRKLSVVVFNNMGLSRNIWPALSTADLPVEEMAGRAVLLLINELSPQSRLETPLIRMSLSCELHHRDSVAGVPTSR